MVSVQAPNKKITSGVGTSLLRTEPSIEILTVLKTRTKPMSKNQYKIAASQPNSKAAIQYNVCREAGSQANGFRDRI